MHHIPVSVVIPAYNCAAVIRQALDSVLIQEVPLEVILIDDASQDDLAHVIAPYLSDPRIRFYQNRQNLGVSATRNRGVSLARGEYIAFLDGDDVWAPGKLQKQLARIRETGCVLCSTARELMTPDGSRTGRIIPVDAVFSYKKLLHNNQVNCSSVLLRADAAREFPMEHDDCSEDYLTWLRVLRKYGSACGVNEPLLYYRMSNTGKSGSKLHSAKLTFRTYKYMGFGPLKTVWYFLCYAFHGVCKYTGSRLHKYEL